MYKDRVDAGRKLAKALEHFNNTNTVILALPRGGVVLGAEVARELQLPLGLVLVRKIGHPTHAEYAIGAVAEGEKPIYDNYEFAVIDKEWLKGAEASARDLIKQRRELYFGQDIAQPELLGKTIVLVDDGIATGLTMKAAVMSVRNKKPKRIIIAVPVAAQDSVDMLKNIVDEVIVLSDTKRFLGAVGAHYEIFDQVDDNEVRTIIKEFDIKSRRSL